MEDSILNETMSGDEGSSHCENNNWGREELI